MKLSIVIPAYNEEHRIGSTLDLIKQELCDELRDDLVIEEVIISDDGSTDQTLAICGSHRSALPGLKIVRATENRGKGFASRTGLQAASSHWVLLADADSATPWTEIYKLKSEAEKADASIAIGSRDVPGSEISIHQSKLRESLGKAFNVFIRATTRLPFRDTQCGFKLVKRNAVLPFLDHLSVDRFAWDIEFLMRAQSFNLKIVEVPVKWHHVEGSKISPLRDGIEMLWSVCGIRVRDLFNENRKSKA